MTRFEYLTTFVSIILGLGVADLLQSAYHLVQERDHVRFHWLPLAWALIVLLQVTLFFWSFYEFGQHDVWRYFPPFVFLLMGPVLLFLASANALPDSVPKGEAFDLERFYFDRPRGFFLILAAYMGCVLINSLLVGEAFLAGRQLIILIGALLFLGMAWKREHRYHVVATLLVSALFAAFVVNYAFEIG